VRSLRGSYDQSYQRISPFLRRVHRPEKVLDGSLSFRRRVLDASCSKPADGLRSLDDVRALAISAIRDLAPDGTSFQVIQLQNTLEQALEAVLSLRNEFSPINRLPTETLSHIFDLVCAQDQDDSHVHTRHVTTLAQVCSQWRSNVISTPLLWSTIHVSQQTQPEFIALCLERSKDVPLEIVLETRGELLAFTSLPAYPRSNTPAFDPAPR